ncbi:PREDICTED: receptor-like serine/threonine-protein kinase SD1-8 [Ipomoea nil]|uniref:receptor-like serine/threonine-protein kinase SD1-8 n=1 Tax=Ipomoea nil TaxID=35883 RepID=UPI000900B32D|nr:PREDICTED: receptor-like serine/threonine-protein kinase SD1-8 [Ipomoea nil]
MEMNFFVVLSCLLILLNTPFSHGVETIISGNKYITQGRTISSPNGRFELGFFTPGQSSKYYIGIWYKNISPQTVVWVANRVTPIPSSAIKSSKLRVLDGDLVLVDGAQNLVWSTNLSVTTVKRNSVLATLRDSGNLVLSEDGMNSTTPLWQSFEHPTDTHLPGAKFGYNKRTKTTYGFTSWKSWDDPASGLYSLDNNGDMGFLLWNRTEEYGRSGHKFGTDTNPSLKPNPLFNFTVVDNENQTYFTYNLLNPSLIGRHVIQVDGREKQLTWSESTQEWMMTYVQPLQKCDVYAYCGPFGFCNDNSTTVCVCLQGFKYKSEREWRLFNEFSGGCVRNTSLKCSGTNNYQEEDMDVDSFIMYPNVRLPRHPQNITAETQTECESTCLKNCSCTAYAYSNSSGGHCWIWVGQLLNLKQLGEDDINGSTIYIRLAATEFSNIKGTYIINNTQWLMLKCSFVFNYTNSKQFLAIIASVAVAAAALVACTIFCVCYKRRRAALKITVDETIDEDTDDDENGIGVPLITFQSILEATNNFSDANKLGEGGFGPVYKGMLLDGQEVAIKRLSSQSSQGINEFKNEVVLIGKLQHRNLVKLIGYCTQVGEKILLYEYMPNKSLDIFIFDQTRRLLLDWSKRFDIILGIVRGLVYLHHDSRLRIIHRDIKTNNILLDEEMIPKISDFGLARLVAGNTFEANTKKVAGTYGYMSPEYALSGLFSTKSDVFSFGVIILEIICGMKNTAFYQHEEVSNLLGYAWKLWNEGNAMDLLDDSVLVGCCKECEVLKCINVGLLCVEEDPNRRPSMPTVFLMLTDESMNLPKPYQPAFVTRNRICNDPSTIESDKPCSNQLTFSAQEGR